MVGILSSVWFITPIFSLFVLLSKYLHPVLNVTEIIFLSIPFGYIAAGWSIYLVSYLLGELSEKSIYGAIVLFISISFPHVRYVLQNYYYRRFLWRGELRNRKTLGLLVLVAGLIFRYFYRHHYFYKQDTSYLSAGTTWGDLALHLNIINSFVHGINKNIPLIPKSPLFAGEKLQFTFLPQFHIASLIVTGLSEREALILANTLLAVSFVGLLYLTHLKLIGKSHTAVVGIIIAFLCGGFGCLIWIYEYSMSFHINIDLDFVERWRIDEQHPLFWWGSFSHLFISQISTIYSYPCCCGVFLLLLHTQDIKNQCNLHHLVKLSFFSGLFCCLLVLYQIHSFAFLFFFSFILLFAFPQAVYANKNVIVGWFIFYLPILFIALPCILIFFAEYSLTGNLQLTFQFAWKESEYIAYFFPSLANMPYVKLFITPILFWLMNLGLFIPCLILSFFFCLKTNLQRKVIVSISLIFVICNCFQFQTWKNDNLKMLCFWMFISSCCVSEFLFFCWNLDLSKRFPNSKFINKHARGLHSTVQLATIVLFILLIFSGLLSVRREIYQHAEFCSDETMAVGKWIIENTKPDDIFLTSSFHVNPASVFAGRAVYATFPGWLMAANYPGYERRAEVINNLTGVDVDELNAVLYQNNVSYLLLPPDVKHNEHFPNREVFARIYKMVFESENFIIYNVKIF